MGRKKSVDKTINLEAEVLKATKKEKQKVVAEPAAPATVLMEPETLPAEPVAETKTKTHRKKQERLRSKKYTQLISSFDTNKFYPLKEAIELCQKNSFSKFIGSLELHLTLGVDLKDENQKIRTNVSLPHGSGKKIRLMAFVGSEKAEACLKAGADFIGTEKTIDEILDKERTIDFDKVVATPDFMPKLAKVAKILGPKGLMPSPKNGTVASEPEKAIAEVKKGRLEIKMDPTAPVIHLALGKLSFPAENLVENFGAVIQAIKEAKPAKAKADYLLAAYLSPTMGPSVKLDLSPFK